MACARRFRANSTQGPLCPRMAAGATAGRMPCAPTTAMGRLTSVLPSRFHGRGEAKAGQAFTVELGLLLEANDDLRHAA
jgi:hypothetical protein